jgi:hypothetical protein
MALGTDEGETSSGQRGDGLWLVGDHVTIRSMHIERLFVRRKKCQCSSPLHPHLELIPVHIMSSQY